MADLTVAKTILEQLGGRKFIAMTGAKNLVGDDRSLLFAIGRNDKRINKVKIRLTDMDDYTLEAWRWKGAGRIEMELVDTREGVYCDNLREVFTRMTGLDTRMPVVVQKRPNWA